MTNKLKLELLEELLIQEKVEGKLRDLKQRLLDTKNNLISLASTLKCATNITNKEGGDLLDAIYDISDLSTYLKRELDPDNFDYRYRDLMDREEDLKDKHENLRLREEELLENIARFNEYKRKNYLTLKEE